mgnify:CR=1 FL=1
MNTVDVTGFDVLASGHEIAITCLGNSAIVFRQFKGFLGSVGKRVREQVEWPQWARRDEKPLGLAIQKQLRQIGDIV